MANNMQDYLVNVDLSRSQFDVDKLFEEAGRLGMDFGDLQDYGIEVNSSKCGKAMACITKDSIKGLDDAVNKGNKFSNKFFNEALTVYQKAQCHDDFRSKVTPKVQGLLSTYPCGFFISSWSWICEIPNCILCFCCECPYRCCFQTPNDAIWTLIGLCCSLIVLSFAWFIQLYFLSPFL